MNNTVKNIAYFNKTMCNLPYLENSRSFRSSKPDTKLPSAHTKHIEAATAHVTVLISEYLLDKAPAAQRRLPSHSLSQTKLASASRLPFLPPPPWSVVAARAGRGNPQCTRFTYLLHT
ncbi:hypothetical protein E2C01_034272 [Portunus trituberculatus]|uniref:Uncharacterized protein n=1 Tax=Portunus trituberculatus TaxID=210409 RepID=A0A5B7F5B3_PORTR|nr:hypothetical protein [Portunus trituberculatus]